MSPGYFLYNLVCSLAGPLVLAGAAASGRLDGGWLERLGLASGPPAGEGPRIWLHAVSAGEIQVAAGLRRALATRLPGADIRLSSTTRAGRQAAVDLGLPVLTFPLDFFGAPGRALSRLKPDLVIILETELWPNFLREAKSRGVKIMLAHGRISPRSFKNYRRARFFFREVLSCFDLMAMIGPEDAARIIDLGADPSRVLTAGEAKAESVLARVDHGRAAALRGELGLTPERPVVTAGSTRPGEEVILLDVFSRLKADFPDLHLILAPRHVGRAEEVESLIRSRGFSLARRGRGKGPSPAPVDVTLVDVMGELFYLYEPALVAFCGASLVPLGGQNILEPAAWGRPVVYGPHLEDFTDARELLEGAGAGLTVRNADELYLALKKIISNRDLAAEMGRAGRRALETRGGTSDRLAALALTILPLDKKEKN
ncbi:MAG: 3-deoxy-D-manno-octulosonic acid transferase [Pseudomonadota bacterium]